MKGGYRKTEDNRYSRDHIYPVSMLNSMPEERVTAAFKSINTVPCCGECNSYKGRLSPLDWLVIMPDNHNAAKLAQRLIKMGENMEVVFDCLRRRKR